MRQHALGCAETLQESRELDNRGRPHPHCNKHDAFDRALPTSGKNLRGPVQERKNWLAWKKLYKSADQKSKVKNKSVGGGDQFGAAHGTLRHAPEIGKTKQKNVPNRSVNNLNECFDALAAEATRKKTVMEELAIYNAALTTTNVKLSASVEILIKANEKLYCQVGNRQGNQNPNTRTREYSPPCPKTLFHHCKLEVMHSHDSCFELKKNAARCPRVWKSWL